VAVAIIFIRDFNSYFTNFEIFYGASKIVTALLNARYYPGGDATGISWRGCDGDILAGISWWGYPGGDAKQFKSEALDMRWYPESQSITLNGRR
jgi:hypothetical protein